MRIGAEAILAVIIAPFFIWVVSSIYNLQASTGMDAFKIEQIKGMLETQDKKIDNITEILIKK